MKAAQMAASGDATVLMASAPTQAPAATTPAAAPTGRVTPAAAKTLIMDLPATHAAGVVTLESDPPNALVFVDGKQVGATPLPDHDVSFGPHEIRLEAPGCEPALIALDVSREAPLRALTVSLAPAKPKDGTIHAGQFMPFGPDVVPPCRVSGELPVYPEEARRRGLAGSASVEVWVGEKGEVIDLAVIESAGATLDGALLDAVSHWRFTPARVRGVPVSVRLRVQHHFRG
jgi:TonB family protein